MTNQIALTIVEQLGGNRAMAMLPLKAKYALVSRGEGLDINLKQVSYVKDRITRVSIVLNASDLYDITASKWNAKAMKWVEVASAEDVYADMLQDIFEELTGLYLTLSPRRAA